MKIGRPSDLNQPMHTPASPLAIGQGAPARMRREYLNTWRITLRYASALLTASTQHFQAGVRRQSQSRAVTLSGASLYRLGNPLHHHKQLATDHEATAEARLCFQNLIPNSCSWETLVRMVPGGPDRRPKRVQVEVTHPTLRLAMQRTVLFTRAHMHTRIPAHLTFTGMSLASGITL